MTHPPATCELCGDTGLYTPSALPCPKGCSSEDIVDRLQFIGAMSLDQDAAKLSYQAAEYITHLRQALSETERRGKEARAKALEEAAKACDRIAGNTADFDKYTRRASGMCAAAVRALKDEVR